MCCMLMQLALLWPSGVMHVDGIKRAIYRSKDRKGLLGHTKVCSTYSFVMVGKIILDPFAQCDSLKDITMSIHLPL